MKALLIIVLVVLWAYSYYRFKQKYYYFCEVVKVVHAKCAMNSDNCELLLRYASALIEIQHYKDALDIYNQILATGYSRNIDKIRQNIEFCQRPIPGVSAAKNFSGSWWHNFILIRFGRRRYNFLDENDLLETNSIIRMKKYH